MGRDSYFFNGCEIYNYWFTWFIVRFFASTNSCCFPYIIDAWCARNSTECTIVLMYYLSATGASGVVRNVSSDPKASSAAQRKDGIQSSRISALRKRGQSILWHYSEAVRAWPMPLQADWSAVRGECHQPRCVSWSSLILKMGKNKFYCKYIL